MFHQGLKSMSDDFVSCILFTVLDHHFFLSKIIFFIHRLVHPLLETDKVFHWWI